MQDGGDWNGRKLGFTFVTTRASRAKLSEAELGVHPETLRKWIEEKNRAPELASIERMILFINTFLVVVKQLVAADLTDEVPFAVLCGKLGLKEEDFFRSEYSSHFAKCGPQNDYVMVGDEVIASQVSILR